MALTVTSDLQSGTGLITTAEALLNWNAYNSGGAHTWAIEPDFFAQGSNCVSSSIGSTGVATKGGTFNYGSGLNFSTTHAGKLIFMWVRASAPAVADTRAAGGIMLILGSGSTAPEPAAGAWNGYYVDGSDTWVGTDGWKCYAFDPRLPASTSYGGGCSLAAIQHFGAVQRNAAGKSAKGQGLGIDQICYGFGELYVSGTVTTPGAGFAEVAAVDFGTIGNRWGVISAIKEGVISVQGRIVLGDDVGTAGLTFTSQNETLIWGQQAYYDGTRVRATVRNARPDGTPYFGIHIVGNSTNDTDVALGAAVGADAGRSGGAFTGSRIRTGFVLESGIKSTSVIEVYGATFTRFRGGFDLTPSLATDKWFSGSINQSGTFDPGKISLRNVNFIDNLGASYDFLEDFLNDGTSAEALATADPSVDWGNALGGTALTVPAGTEYVGLDALAAARQVAKINSDVVGSDNHYAEATIRFPTGTNQGTLGVFIRASTTLATENYWFLQCDRVNSLISLIQCDGGTDTSRDTAAFTFAADTDYQVHLYGSGTLIEGFVNGTKVDFTSSTYQTNRWVGIRGTTNGSQTGNAPRVSRFGCGPITNDFGACRWATIADVDVEDCTFINNARALSITVAGAYSSTGNQFSGNRVSVRNVSNGAATIAADSILESGRENTGSGTLTVTNNKVITISGLTRDARVLVVADAGGPETEGDTLASGEADAAGAFTAGYDYTSDQPVLLYARLSGWLDYVAAGTITSSGLTVVATWQEDTTHTPAYSRNRSVDLDGSADYIIVDGMEAVYDHNNGFSILAWYKRVTGIDSDVLFSFEDANGSARCTLSVTVFESVHVIGKDDADVTAGELTSLSSVSAVGVWEHLGIAYKPSSTTGRLMRINGAAVGFSVNTATATDFSASLDTAFLGARESVGNPFNGHLLQLVVVDRMLTVAELDEHYNGGVPINPRSLSYAGDIVSIWIASNAEYDDATDPLDFRNLARTSLQTWGYGVGVSVFSSNLSTDVP